MVIRIAVPTAMATGTSAPSVSSTGTPPRCAKINMPPRSARAYCERCHERKGGFVTFSWVPLKHPRS
jgi:hypothetical protein